MATQANITADTLSRSEECLAIHSDYFADGGPRTRGGELSRSTSTEMVCTSPGEVPMPALSALLQRARSRSAPVMALEYTASSVEVLPIPGEACVMLVACSFVIICIPALQSARPTVLHTLSKNVVL